MSLANDTSAIFDAALALPREKREELVRELVISLDADQSKDPDYDRLWAEEIQRRWAEYERGEVELVENDEAMRRIERAIQRGKQS
jgi:putative addiction module component (TIGR02574 family)